MGAVFENILGNAYIKTTLAPSLASGTASHGYILSGPAGSGKKTLARLMAAAALCENRLDDGSPLPCGRCPSCHKVLSDISTDVFWISRGDKASVSVEQIRQVRQGLYIPPNDGDRKFYIFEDAHTMTDQAQNALLLSLEEPPPFVHFLLLTEDHASLLETIRSRAPVIQMELFSPQVVLDWLDTHLPQKNGSATGSETDTRMGAAVLSGGALGKALLLAGPDGEKSEPMRARTLALTLLEIIFSQRTSELLGSLAGLLPSSVTRESMCLVFRMARQALRDLIVQKKLGNGTGLFLLGDEVVCRYGAKWSVSRLLALYDCCETALRRLEANGSVLPCVTGFVLTAKTI